MSFDTTGLLGLIGNLVLLVQSVNPVDQTECNTITYSLNGGSSVLFTPPASGRLIAACTAKATISSPDLSISASTTTIALANSGPANQNSCILGPCNAANAGGANPTNSYMAVDILADANPNYCPSFVVVNGTVTYSSDQSYGSSATVSCDAPYSISSSTALICNVYISYTSGTWNRVYPTCSPRNNWCSSPIKPTNGNVTYNSNLIYGTVATYSCQNGWNYTVQASVCAYNQQWSPLSSSCVPLDGYCPTITAVFPVQSISYTGNRQVTTQAVYSCATAYQLQSGGSRTCQSDQLASGTWSAPEPVCVRSTNWCPPLSNPSNGTVNFPSSRSIDDVATYSCARGYQLDHGTGSATCLVNQSWSDSFTCVPIGQYCSIDLPTPSPLAGADGPNGQVYASYSLNGQILSTVNYSCDAGYSLSGIGFQTCGASNFFSGLWSDVIPTCVPIHDYCPTLSTVPNGGFQLSYSQAVSSEADYFCSTGYSLTGPSSLFCRAPGSWSLSRKRAPGPSCPPVNWWCQNLTAPAFASIAVSFPIVIDTIATYSCSNGYTLTDSPTIQCLVTRSWSGAGPSCTSVAGYCPNLSPPANGSLVFSANNRNVTSTVSYSCANGFQLVGSSVRTCQAFNATDGYWDLSAPVCIKIPGYCPSLSNPSNGLVSSVLGQVAEIATYTCDFGYEFVSETTATCTAFNSTNGFWTTLPLCVAISGYCSRSGIPASLGNGTAPIFSTTPTVVGSTVTYSCSNGWAPNQPSVQTCVTYNQTVGQWNASVPTCRRVLSYCPDITNPARATVTYDPLRKVLDYANFTCVPGTQYSDLSQSRLVQCLPGGTTAGTGVWDTFPPTCDLINPFCPAIVSTPPNTHVFSTFLTVNSTIIMSCDGGYSYPGSTQSTCDYSGNWNPAIQQCQIIPNYCNVDLTDSKGFFNISARSVGSPALMECNYGYETLSGVSSCQSDSSWSSVYPCTPISGYCDPVQTPVNGFEASYSLGDIFQVGSAVSYNCAGGYTISGTQNQTCIPDTQTTGKWSAAAPLCVPIMNYCTPATNPVNGTYSTNDTDFEVASVVTYSCDIGFQISGQPVRTCLPSDPNSLNGFWDFPAATCVPYENYCKSTDISPPLHGGVLIPTYRISQVANFFCQNGYNYTSGSPANSLCSPFNQTDGFWTEGASSCTIVQFYCAAISTPTNGNAPTYSGAGKRLIGSTVSQTCQTAYTLNGAPSRTCNSNSQSVGQWSAPDPTCDPTPGWCPTIADPSFGTVSQPVAAVIYDIATFSCSLGYRLTATSTGVSSCQLNRTWTPESTCEEYPNYCPDVSPPSNGDRTYTSRTITGTLSYTCNEGYVINGNAGPLNCQTSTSTAGTWPSAPTCNFVPEYCNALTAPTNGSLSVPNGDIVTSVATYSCDVGYFLVGSKTSVCTAVSGNFAPGSGLWSNAAPVCNINTTFCPSLSNPLNGTVGSYFRQIFSVATYSCNTGFVLSGSPTATCQSSGQWTAAPTCITINGFCPSLSVPSNGLLALSGLNAGSVVIGTNANFSCINGYQLVGNPVLTCQNFNGTAGLWNFAAPTCALINGYCPVLTNASIANGWVVVPTTRYLGDIATYTCNAAWQLVIQGSSTVTCLTFNSTAGQWSVAPSCGLIPFYCNSPSSLVNGAVNTTNSQFTFGTTIQYTCNPGYSLSGSPIQTCQLFNATKGNFNGTTPTCNAIPNFCGTLSVTSNVLVSIASTTFVGSVANISCPNGFALSGSPTAQCQVSGSWSLPGTCPAIFQYCPSVPTPTNGSVSYANSRIIASTLTYTCGSGYQLSAGQAAIRTCLASNPSVGVWNGTDAIDCVLSNGYCSVLTSPTNGLVSSVSGQLGEIATYSCNSGFQLQGSSTAVCQLGGAWTPLPTCVPIVNYCPSISSPSFGSVVVTPPSHVLGASASFSCALGYNLTGGTSSQSCVAGNATVGIWPSAFPTCAIITGYCPAINLTNGQTTYATREVGDTVVYTCNSGYVLSTGGSVRVGFCSTSTASVGVWTNVPTCNVITPYCPVLTGIGNGTVSYTNSRRIGDVANIICSVGHSVPVANPTCLAGTAAAGIWSDAGSTTCTPILDYCPLLSNPTNGAVAYPSGTTRLGDAAVISCAAGYNGTVNNVFCGVGGTTSGSGVWGSVSIACNIINNFCPTLTATPPLFISFDLSNNVIQTVANYSCARGYTLVGSTTRQCNALRQWTSAAPVCTLTPSWCPQLNPIISTELGQANGTLDYLNGTDSRRLGDFVIASCPQASTLNGDSVRSCQVDRTWTGTDASCAFVPSYCPWVNSTLYKTNYSGDGNRYIGDYVVITCPPQFALVGTATLQCQYLNDTMGRWSAVSPICQSTNVESTASSQPPSVFPISTVFLMALF